MQKLSVGSIPRSLLVVLENDLVDSCKSGKKQCVRTVQIRFSGYLTVCGSRQVEFRMSSKANISLSLEIHISAGNVCFLTLNRCL